MGSDLRRLVVLAKTHALRPGSLALGLCSQTAATACNKARAHVGPDDDVSKITCGHPACARVRDAARS